MSGHARKIRRGGIEDPGDRVEGALPADRQLLVQEPLGEGGPPTAEAAEVNTTFVSLLASCGLHQLEAWAYLRDLPCLSRVGPGAGSSSSPPVYWQQTREEGETQRRLGANPFRAPTLALNRPHRDTG